jgi:DNA helicase II / ATP-dependent DNA helicase PcrA
LPVPSRDGGGAFFYFKKTDKLNDMPKEFVLNPSGAAPRIDFAGDLNAEQLEAVKNADGYSLVLAGAGSGKTRTIIYRVAYLLKQGIPAEQILLLTFTNKAAREMLSRVEYLLGAFPARLTGGTFHHVSNMLLRRYAQAAGFNNNFSILDQEDSRDLVNVCIKDAGIDTKQRRFPSASVLQSFWSYSRNARLPFAEVVDLKQPRLANVVPKMEMVIDAYETRKKNANAMDFDDLLVRATDLLRTNPAIRERVAGQYRHVLVDEYQDTNRVQAEFLSLISSVHGNLLVVGDDAQSIYSFRAADIQNILGFPDRFKDAKIFKLETNYRSVPPILDLANESIKNNIGQFQKVLRPANSQPATRTPQPNLVAAGTAEEEAQFIAEMILKLRDEGLPLSEIAVLFRATFHSQTLEFELTKRDIPYDYRGGIRFFERSHIKDVLSFLRIMVNPADEVCWLRALRIQTGIGTETAGQIFYFAKGAATLEDAIAKAETSLPSRANAGWKDFSLCVRAMNQAAGSPAECIRAIVKSSYGDYLDNEFPNADERREDLEQLAIFAGRYDSLGGFLAESALHEGFSGERTGGADEDEEKIVLSTIHQAKGLEWDAVFAMHLFDGAFPNAKAMEEDEGIEEERRLFYVAATRARKNLFLTYPLTGGAGADYLHQPSQFIRELSPEVYEEVILRRASASGTTVFKDDFFEEDAIDLNGSENPSSGAKDWKTKSFLGDY